MQSPGGWQLVQRHHGKPRILHLDARNLHGLQVELTDSIPVQVPYRPVYTLKRNSTASRTRMLDMLRHGQ
jgi:hypothetical protein